MSKQSELPCWKIILCNSQSSCRLAKESEIACWELVAAKAFIHSHICRDCLVYVAKQKDSILSDEEFCSILTQRKAMGTQKRDCSLAHVLR